MVMFILLLLVSRSHTVAGDEGNSSASVEYVQIARRLLPELCPGANVCLSNYTTNGTHENNFGPGLTSCCTECSCDLDCEETRTCCFPHAITSKQEAEQTRSVCFFSVIPQPQGVDRIYYQSYSMISDVPKTNVTNNDLIPSTICGDENVAPWGSFLPVFSKKTKTIYKNRACAKAAGVTDGEIWDIELSCNYKTDIETNDVSSFISGLYLESLPDNCKIQFFYPGDNSDLKSEICFEDLISTCPQLNFEKPELFSKSTRKEIRQACMSELISPYRVSNMYANVFCHICNGAYYAQKSTCKETRTARGGKIGRFVSLIDGDLMSTIERKSTKGPSILQACFKDGENGPFLCRTVYCPSGQTRDIRGNCVFPAKKWYIDNCAVNLKLTAKNAFDINEIYDIKDNSEITYFSPHKWPKNWAINTVSYEFLNEYEKWYKTLYVQMVNFSPITDPTDILKNIQNFLKRPWTLKMSNNTLISMSAELVHKTALYHVALSAPVDGIEVKDAKITVPKFVYMYVDYTNSALSPFVITPLYYCEQIELDVSEFELHAQNAVLWDKITNQTFLIGEFTTIQSDGYTDNVHTVRARICLSDSGFTKRELLSGSAITAAESRIFMLTWICLLGFSNA